VHIVSIAYLSIAACKCFSLPIEERHQLTAKIEPADNATLSDAAAQSRLFLFNLRRRKTMPYDTLDDLPENVTNVLPKHAQEIYRAAFNSAWDEYKDPDERKGHASREETAHKVAWAAVKKEYEKVGDEWRRKS